MKRAILFVLLLGVKPALFSQNLVFNPGFETWGKIDKPSGWNTAQNCLKDSVNIISGSYSCRHEGDSSATKYLGQTIAVVPGKEYTLSFQCKMVIVSSGKGARIWCYWKDVEKKSITDSSTAAILRPSKYMKNDIWQESSINVIAPANAAYFYLEVRIYQNSIAYWDDFVFEENLATFSPENKFPGIIIYPNPTPDYLHISNIQNIQYIDIHNFTGTTIWSSNFAGEQKVTIPVSGIEDGVYFIRIRTSNNLITRKFIKKSN